MSLKEQTIILIDKDGQGNTIMQFPITKAKNIEDVMSIAQGGTGASDANGARTNLGLERFTSNQNFTDLDSNYTATPTSEMSLNFFGDDDKLLWGAVLNFVFGRGTGGNQNNGGQLIMGNGDMGLLYRTQDTNGGTGWGPLRQVAFKNDLNGIVAANLAQNGYVKFSNRLILQWGVYTSGTRNVTITLPIATSVTYAVIAVARTNNNYGCTGSQSCQYVSNITNKTFQAGSYDAGNGYAGFWWLSIGKA